MWDPRDEAGFTHQTHSLLFRAKIGSTCLGIDRKNQGLAGADFFSAGLCIGLPSLMREP
jgi:hypothetical protein